MMVLVAYDVSTKKPAGQRRLRKVATACMRYGQRVQNSVFECLVSPDQLVELRAQLLKIYDKNTDSLRFYNLGDKYENRIDSYGVKRVLLSNDDLFI